MQPVIYASIINWNSNEKTLRCVQMLQRQTYPHLRIVVVDNASQAPSLAQLRAALPDDVQLIESASNEGYAGGQEIALHAAQRAGADFFWLLNTDIELQPEAAQLFLDAHAQYGDALYGTVPVQVVPGAAVEDYPVLFHQKFFLPDYREMIFRPQPSLRFGQLFPTMTVRSVAAVAGSCVFIPMAIIEQHGFMDTDYFLYSEEVDYCFRLRRAGVPVYVVPAAYITHESGGTSRAYTRLQGVIFYYKLRNQLVRIKRYGTPFDLFKALLKDVLLVLYHLVLGGRAGIDKARFGLYAIRDGMRGKLGKTYAPEEYMSRT